MTLPITALDHLADGTSKVISQYRGKVKFLLRLACYLNSVQRAEDQLEVLHVAFRPSTATGFRLDWIGAKVGQRRIGPTDAVYRLYILARIAVNRSAGQVADLIRVAGILLTSYRYREAPTAVLVDTALGQVPAERAATWALLQAAAPAGVSVHLVESLTDGTTDLTFSTVAEGVDPSVQGFDSVAGLTLAGTWATVNGPIA